METPLSQVIELLRRRRDVMTDYDKGFAESVIRQYDTRGWISAKQENVIRKIARNVSGTRTRLLLANITALVNLAASKDAKRIAIRLTVGNQGVVLRYSPKTNRIYINEAGNFEEGERGQTYGYVSLVDSELRLNDESSAFAADLTNALIAFNADPHKAGRLEGHATGRCCFCSIKLTTAESVHHGYGPICAERFGLPWGDSHATNSDNLFRIVHTHEDAEPLPDDVNDRPLSREVLLAANLLGDEPIGIISRNTLLKLLG